jgi:hypothetical protein
LLRTIGWSCQRPTGQARQRAEAAIRHWKRRQWPRLKKRRSRRPNDHLRRRVRLERVPPSGANLGSARPNPRVAIDL